MKHFLKRYSLVQRALVGPRAIRRTWISWRQKPGEIVLNRISEIFRGKVILEVKEFDGVFSINPRSHLLNRVLRYGYYEPRVARLFAAHVQPDADVIDVGANVGFFTVAGAKKLVTGRVLAAEPTTEAFDRLKENVSYNQIADKVILFKGMIGSARGQGKIHFVPGIEEYSSMHTPEHFATKGKEIRTESVPIETLDYLVELYGLRPAVLKVDVEGAEFSVFQGAYNTISKYRPVVISEIWREPTKADGHSGNDLVEMFRELGYMVRDPNDPHGTPGAEIVGEVICIPKERYDPSMI